MAFGKFSGESPKKGIVHKEVKGTKALSHIECLENAFFQISSVINAHKDLQAIFEVIVQESLYCLKAHRSAIFLLDEKNGILKIQCTHVSDPSYEQIGLNEEREVAQKTLKNNKPFLLGGQGNFSDFFKYQKQGRKVTSLMSIPFSSNGKAIGLLSVVMIDEESGFDEKSLQFFSSFANLVSTAMEMVRLVEEVRKGNHFRNTYERYLDNILSQLQNLSDKEPPRIDRPIMTTQPEQKVDKEEFQEGPTKERVVGVQRPVPLKVESGPAVRTQVEQKVDKEEIQEGQTNEGVPWMQGTIALKEESEKEESGINRRQHERVDTVVRVEFHDEYWGFTKNLSKGGAFILTPDPMELGDEFLLKLHMPDGGEPIEVGCKVVWTNKYGKETHDLRRGMGIKFLTLRREDRTRFEEYLEAYKSRNL
jgi:uncharacterized protein (TIGR02266 family)